MNQVREEPVHSTISIDELLESGEKDHTQYLEGYTIEKIGRQIYDSLHSQLPAGEIAVIYGKLTGYRYVDELYLLHRGKYVRWIRANSHKLETGGIVVDIKIMDTGAVILCKLGNIFTQYKFNECLTYQKLSKDELLVLTAYTAIENTTASDR
jgi:hypothetical protein